MAAGLVSHNITTASGVTFAVRSWVPDTASPDVGCVPVALLTDGTNLITLVNNALATTDYALPVMIHPDSQNANGQTTMANSTPVVLPSDQSAIPVTPAGNVAHGSADSGNPVKQGAKATTALSGLTLVANAGRTDLFAGVDGVQIMRPHCNLEDIVTGNATNTDGTSTQCIAAQAAGIKTYLVSVVLANTSATAITVDIKDGSTVKTSLPLPAGSGCVYNPPVPIPGTAATAWNFDGSAAATTVTCSMVGFKSKV